MPSASARAPTHPVRAGAIHHPRCRFCSAELQHGLVDLGLSPLCQKHVEACDLDKPETFHPLRAWVCDACWLVQLEDLVTPQQLFADGSYAYFSSYSDSWLAHARRYAEQMIAELALDGTRRVVEIASNDGYLLQYFAEKGVPVLGIEPASNCAEVARARGIQTRVEFFSREGAERLREECGPADLLLGNNVLAHVPDINDFVAGLRVLLAAHGWITMEFPHLMRLVEENQFDTIYHEHCSYLGFGTVLRIFAQHDLEIFDVERLPTHGGSLRIYARHSGHAEQRPVSERVHGLLELEERAGMRSLDYYRRFGERVEAVKRGLLAFLIEARSSGRKVVGYGAPGKGNTLLNYCGIRSDLLAYTVDRSPHKQGRYLPGTRIPILEPGRIFETRPDYVLILPWNLQEEIMQQLSGIRAWGGRFVVPIPEVRVLS